MSMHPPQDAPAGGPVPFPYVDWHTGPKRVIWLRLAASGTIRNFVPSVAIDGRHYYVRWGDLPFEVPADRPVHLSARVETSEGSARIASTLLLPGDDPYITYDGGTAFRGGSMT